MSEVYRTPDERFASLPDYPFEPNYIELDGLRMHYLAEGDASADSTLLLLHGEPTWSFLYRKMIPILAERARVLAPDYFGFGRSDKPTAREFYTYDRHVDSITRFAQRLRLSRLTLVVHDWGGPIGLRFAVENPDLVRGLVIMNTGVFSLSDRWPTPQFLAWRNFAEQAGLDLPVGFIIQSATATEIRQSALAGYEAPFPTPESKTGAAMFPLMVPIARGDPGVAEMLATREGLRLWDKPALVLFGEADPVFPPWAARALAALVPTAGEPELVAGASHFLQEDKGEEIAPRITAFLEETATR